MTTIIELIKQPSTYIPIAWLMASYVLMVTYDKWRAKRCLRKSATASRSAKSMKCETNATSADSYIEAMKERNELSASNLA
ncbi:MAG: hypothetical protein PHW79_06145 [Candidatus Marinimicrobia bacterium]|nr:hypothetical protein [Candidatus Neomarinimicrobiota bacterium]